jgi:hypothetical protein
MIAMSAQVSAVSAGAALENPSIAELPAVDRRPR